MKTTDTAASAVYSLAIALALAVAGPCAQTKDSTPVAVPDSISTPDGRIAVADLTRDDINKLSYNDLINLPFETVVLIANKMEVSFDDLLKTKLTISSKTSATVREQPGILSIITDEDIKNNGCRNMIDVLRMVPGLFFGSDIEGINGFGMRGCWGYEGKILILLDGQEMQELRYLDNPVGNHLPLDNIKRIEIIRGPGSTIYGGAAELGVINIITRTGSDLRGGSASMSGGLLAESPGQNTVTLSGGNRIGGLDFSLSGFCGGGYRTGAIYKPFYFKNLDPLNGMEVDTLANGHGRTSSANVNLGASWRGLSLRSIFDYYHEWGVDNDAYIDRFTNWTGDIDYAWNLLNDKLTITPRYTIKLSRPWWTAYYGGNEDIVRNSPALAFEYHPHPRLSLIGGVEGYRDAASLETPDSTDYYFNNHKPRIDYTNEAAYMEALFKTPLTNIFAGGRLENHSVYGTAFAPRIGFTHIISDFNFKLLLSKAFRPPSSGNIEMNPSIKPEETYVGEFEAGYAPNKWVFMTANAFTIKINKPIYYFDNGQEYGYKNGTSQGSRGVECEIALRSNRANAKLNYSYYIGVNQQGLDHFNAAGVSGIYLAAPQHKIGFNSNLFFGRHLVVSPTLVLLSKTYGNLSYRIDTVNNVVVPLQGVLPATLEADLYIAGNDLFVKGLCAGIGVYDLFNRRYPFVQAYNGQGAPYPGPGREIVAKVSYDFKIHK